MEPSRVENAGKVDVRKLQTTKPQAPQRERLSNRLQKQQLNSSLMHKKRKLSSSKDAADADGLAPIILPGIVDSGKRAYEHLKIKPQSPWDAYRTRGLEVEQGGLSTVVKQRNKFWPNDNNTLYVIRKISGPDAKKKLDMLTSISHKSFTRVFEAFSFDGSFYIVSDYMDVCLFQIVRSRAYPNERELAAILGQILQGLSYLSSKGLEHGNLTCFNILLNYKGALKITNHECCNDSRPSNKSNSKDLRALSSITMELMQKHVKDDGAVGVDDLKLWPSDSNAVDFLSATTSATTVDVLLEHPLIKSPWQREELDVLVLLGGISVARPYKYSPEFREM